jgi:N-acetylmuramate 1-kinase
MNHNIQTHITSNSAHSEPQTLNHEVDARLLAIKSWLAGDDVQALGLNLNLDSIHPASNDASFRRYFRILSSMPQAQSYILMDAPPPMENIKPFLKVAQLFATQKIPVPDILAFDEDNGFIILSDLGSTTYMKVLDTQDEKKSFDLYKPALDRLIDLQSHLNDDQLQKLPLYDEQKLRDEMQLFIDWYLKIHLAYQPNDEEVAALDQLFDQVVENNQKQIQTWVHRDYHCRNLMYLDDAMKNPGILDFQDALSGPVTYDLVSLLRDAYIKWPEEFQLDCLAYYWKNARNSTCERLKNLPAFDQFYIDYEWMGLQRHLKVLGIFARLYHRDGKAAYLNDIPLVLEYTIHAAKRYSAFSPLIQLFRKLGFLNDLNEIQKKVYTV